MLYIPKGLYGFKTSDKPERSIRCLASRMFFESDNTLRIISKQGVDTILELDFNTTDKSKQVKIKSVCKIDMFDESNSEDKHAMLD
jgi:hypothetical protein